MHKSKEEIINTAHMDPPQNYLIINSDFFLYRSLSFCRCQFFPQLNYMLMNNNKNNRPLDKHCVLLKAPNLMWEADDCLQVKDFICKLNC